MKKKIVLNLDKPRKFNFNLNAMIDFENETGISLMAVGDEWQPSIRELRALLWAGLNQEEEITIEEAGSLISADNMMEVTNEINKAIEQAMPDVDEVKKQVNKGKNKNRPAG